jgi:hypothetical protein
MANIEDIRRKFEEFQTACKSALPKVDPLLVQDVIIHQQQNPQVQPMYTIEVFSDVGSAVMSKLGLFEL